MEITEVRIKLMEEGSEKLQAFCSITFDNCFVIRDLKIIEGTNGPFVAMPSRKLTAHCPNCGCKNHLRAGHCNQCGIRLKEERLVRDADGRVKLYADIAHPINSSCREMIQRRVIEEFRHERERAKEPGYVSRYDDFDVDFDDVDFGGSVRAPAARHEVRSTETHIQPPAHEPRPPHRPQVAAPQTRIDAPAAKSEAPPPSSGPKSGGFGAGIW